MKQQIIQTEDGSHTLFIPELDENYHSTHGAIQESMHVYIDTGLSIINTDEVSLLEIGFGTGLNALLTWQYALRHNKQISYQTLEFYPLDETIWRNLNYPSLLPNNPTALFDKLHSSPWEEEVKLDNNFSITKIKADLTTWKPPVQSHYDVVYFDAFAPGKQQEMWCREIFDKIIARMKPDGVFVTYCAKGAVRRDLQDAGLTMERLPGPPGKNQILRGIKSV